MTVEVRPAVAADAAVLAALGAAAIRATYAAFAQAAVYETVIAQTCTAAAFGKVIAEPPPSVFLVAVEDGQITGFLDFGPEGDGLELRRLYCAVGQTGRGLGARLLGELETRLDRDCRYSAIVHAENRPALAFWARHGFTVTGEVDFRRYAAEHRDVAFQPGGDQQPEPCVVLVRTVPGAGTGRAG